MTILTLLGVLWNSTKTAENGESLSAILSHSLHSASERASEKGQRSVLVITCPVCAGRRAIYSALRGYCVSGAYAVTGAPVRTDSVHSYLRHCTPTPHPAGSAEGRVAVRCRARTHTLTRSLARTHSHKHVHRHANKSGSSLTL